MNRVVELDRLIYSFKEERDEDKLMLVKEKGINNIPLWKPLAKGWEYRLWYEIGERAGLAEAEEILIWENGKEKTVSIEDYVRLYREALSKPMPIDAIFERFSIRVLAIRKKKIESKFLLKTFENYQLHPVREDSDNIYYQKEILKVEELKNIPIAFNEGEMSLKMIFVEKNS